MSDKKHREALPYKYKDKLNAVQYFIDNMLNKTLTMFKYSGLPDSLPERELELILQVNGYGIITEHNGEVVALWGGFAPPYDVYYRPKHVLVNNPWAEINKEYAIGEDCILIRNDPLNRGLMPILNKFGTMLSEADITMMLATINFRAMNVLSARTDNEYESAKAYIKKLEDGELAVIEEEEMQGNVKTQPYVGSATNYLTQVIELQQYIKGSFYQEIGLDCNYNMKRERLSESEAGLNEDVLRPLVDAMLEERQKALDKVNEKYGTNITVEFASSWNKFNDKMPLETEETGEEIEDNAPIDETVENEKEEVVEEVIEEIADAIDGIVVNDYREEDENENKGSNAETDD